jgi:hypothetical protein
MLVKSFIFLKQRNKKQVMNEQHVVENNVLFDLIIDHD